MKKFALLLALLLVIPAVALAQDATEAPTPEIPALAGHYSVKQTVGTDSLDGKLTIDGTGPIYTVTVGAADGSLLATATALATGEVLTVAGGPSSCEPASLIRLSDGTLFGQWIDTSVTGTNIGVEYYTPTASTTDFAGTYDFVGTDASGAQYKGTAEITQGAGGVFALEFNYSTDETTPSGAPSSESGSGLASGNVLGYAVNSSTGQFCGALVVKFAVDRSFTGEFTASTSTTGQASGKPE